MEENSPDPQSNETAVDYTLKSLKFIYNSYEKRAGIKKGDSILLIFGKVLLKIIAIPLFLLLSPVVLFVLIVAFIIAF
ncbi:MAG TPA: hypothetical protein PKC30_10015 [Saprospiraceae bacterium]|nr:hypothetical protein [Saprospiraceae bacterium]